MSGLISSLLEPALRHARRFSYSRSGSEDTNPPLSHVTNVDTAFPEEEDEAPRQQLDGAGVSRRVSPDQRDRPGLISLDDVQATYNTERSPSRPVADDTEAPLAGRDANIARQNGLQGLLPLDDVRSTYVFDEEPVASPSDQESLPFASRNLRNPEARTLDSFGSMSLDDVGGTSMTGNPSYGVPSDMRSTGGTSSISSGRHGGSLGRSLTNLQDTDARPTREGSATNLQMSGHLPANDGMNDLRRQMHQIREMALSSEEKAARMHALMTADYQKLKMGMDHSDTMSESSDGRLNPAIHHTPQSSLEANSYRSASPMSAKVGDSLSVSADDLAPTYQPRPPSTEGQESESFNNAEDDDEDELPLGCVHYRRNVKIQCSDCRKWYTCRHCHDEVETHKLDRPKIKHMLCMLCGHAQRAAEYCKQCGELTAGYYCDICKLWDGDASHSIYHCADCGICRRGEGLGKDYVHCKRCNVCIGIVYATTHRCVERATESDCPICGEWMFTSSRTVVAVKCGHYMHRTCFDALMQTSFKCPICNRSAVNMELQWRKLDYAIEVQPMPSQFTHTKVSISCNDCMTKTTTKFHWLGNKCVTCDSYNTNQIKMINSPSDQELQALQETRAVRELREVERELVSHDVLPQSQEQDPESGRNPVTSREAARTAGIQAVPTEVQGRQALPRVREGRAPNSPSYFFPQSPSHRGSSVDEANDAEMTDQSTMASEENIPDDVGFWGEPVSPTGWNIPSVPRMPHVTMPRVPEGWPRVPEGWPRMPSVSMPSMPHVSMPRAVSPSAIWAAGSPRLSGWNLPSPAFFATRGRSRVVGSEAGGGDERQAEDGDDRGESESSSSESGEDERMEVDAEEDGDVDEMELFGHR